MSVELRVLRGARAGHRQSFDHDVVTIGRRAGSDMAFDAKQDLDVSATHAELRRSALGWTVVDLGSTNGTYVNGKRIAGPTPIGSGDTIGFGPSGPAVQVTIAGERQATAERVALAVRGEARKLRAILAVSILAVAALAGAGYWNVQRSATAQVTELNRLLAQYESLATNVREQTDRLGDTALTRSLERQRDSLRDLVLASRGRPAEEIASVRDELRRTTVAQQGLAAMNIEQISQLNDPAIALLYVEMGGQVYGATAFNVAPSGVLVTNRHNVQRPDGVRASSVEVQFANTSRRIPASVLLVSADPDVDLAIVRIDAGGAYPTVAGLSGDGGIAQGASIVTLGFPGVFDLPMQGSQVKASLFTGTVSKKTDAVLQIDSWAQHGASGSPVFDSRGLVVGVILGGHPGSQGRVVYAVPSDKVAALLPESARAAVR